MRLAIKSPDVCRAIFLSDIAQSPVEYAIFAVVKTWLVSPNRHVELPLWAGKLSLNIPPRTWGTLLCAFALFFRLRRFDSRRLSTMPVFLRASAMLSVCSLALASGCAARLFEGAAVRAESRNRQATGEAAPTAPESVPVRNSAGSNASQSGQRSVGDETASGDSTVGEAVDEAPDQPLGLGSARSTNRATQVSEAEQPATRATASVDSRVALSQSPEQQEAALMAVVAELEALGQLDPESKRQLIADLRETPRAMWQPMLGIYRLALSSRQRAEASQAPLGSGDQRQESSPRQPAGPAGQPIVAEPASKSTSQLREFAASPPLHHEPSPSDMPASYSNQPRTTRDRVQTTTYEAELNSLDNDAPLLARHAIPTGLHASNARERASAAARAAKLASGPADRVAREAELAEWQAYLAESIHLLEENSHSPARTTEEVRRQAELRLLYLAGGDRAAALRPIEGISTTQQEFWSEVVFSLSTYLDAESMPDGPRRAAEARRHLEAALTRLGELSTLSVRNLAFCSKVNSFGIYETYPEDVFEPGQQVLLYAELENFKCEETSAGFVTSLRSSYQIFDARGVRVESLDFSVTDETCRNRRRDFFMRYFIDLPTRIYDGDYTLKITIEDLKGQTSGEATIAFKIKEPKK